MSTKVKAQKTIKSVLVHILLFALAILWVFPVIWLVLSSFKDGSELFTYPLTFFPEHFTLENYKTCLLYTSRCV